jgi:hypothetical protein
MSSNSKGREREDFISKYLERVMPSTVRFGTGDVTDGSGKRSGQ